MTAAKCAVNCAGYPYFGTQWSRECYCGSTAPTVPAPASECSTACSGNDDELCGAGMRLNVYQFGSEPAPSPSSPPTSTPSAPVVDGFEYQRCYTDNVPEVDCAMPCSGDGSETCGNANRLNVYKDPALAVPTSSNLDIVGEFSYKSCWTDNTGDRSLKAVDYRTDDMTIEKCVERCAEYLYFGLEYSRECYCGNELGSQLAPAKCGMLCMGGNGNQWCGGPDRLNLYGKAVRSAPASSSSTSSAESNIISEASSTSEPPVVTSSLSSAEATTSSSSEALTSSDSEVSSTESSASTFPSSTSFSSTSTSTSQGPSLTTITSCPPTPTIADVPELCYYPKFPLPCDKLTSSTVYRSMSTALRSCQISLGHDHQPCRDGLLPYDDGRQPDQRGRRVRDHV